MMRSAVRRVSAILLIAMFLVGPSATAQVVIGTFPILVVNCQSDPGGVNPSSGRGIDIWSESTYCCVPAAGIGVTAYNLELGIQGYCITNQDGLCSIKAPSGPNLGVTLAEHTALLDPGFAPVRKTTGLGNYTEYAGGGFVNLPVSTGTSGIASSRTLLSLRVTGCESNGTCGEAAVLAQISPADLTLAGWPWLTTNQYGFVSFDIGSIEAPAIDLMFNSEARPAITCTDARDGAPVEAVWLDEREGTFYRITPIAPNSVNCDVMFPGTV